MSALNFWGNKIPKDSIYFNAHKTYPKCSGCGHGYLPEIGCVWCNKILKR